MEAGMKSDGTGDAAHSGRRRRRHRPRPSAWSRFKRSVAEQRRRLAVVAAMILSCGGALLAYMLIRPE